MSGEALIRVDIDGDKARKADQWEMGARIRAVDQGPDGEVYLLEDGPGGRLLRLTPARLGHAYWVSGTSIFCSAAAHPVGCGTVRRYGFTVSQPFGNFSLAASSLSDGGMMQSSPCFQLTGVATDCFAVSWMRIQQAQHLVEVAARAHRIDAASP